jgi:hypothetical protein
MHRRSVMESKKSTIAAKVFDIRGRFLIWKYDMEILLKSKKLKEIVNGIVPYSKLGINGVTQKDIDD